MLRELLCCCRYERPGSFYEFTVPALKIGRELGITQGATTTEAAKDIGDGICKPWPKRYVYCGRTLFYSLWWGYIQLWFRPKGMVETLQKRCRLFECAEKGPTTWEGHYILPPPPQPEAETPAPGDTAAQTTEVPLQPESQLPNTDKIPQAEQPVAYEPVLPPTPTKVE